MRRPFTLLLFALLTFIAQASAAPRDEAQRALEEFIDAWNTGDLGVVRETLNYPNLSLFGALTVAGNPDDFVVDFMRMRFDEDWSRSAFGEIEVIRESDSQVHLVTTYTRYNTAGEAYAGGRIFCIVTNQDGHWGLQYRSPVGDSPGTQANHQAIDQTLQQFFEAWNREDNGDIHRTVHFPHAFLIGDGRVSFATGPEDLITDFADMRAREGWDRSTYDQVEIKFAGEKLAFVYLTFHRLNAQGEAYRDTPVLWILTRDAAETWGIQVRVIL